MGYGSPGPFVYKEHNWCIMCELATPTKDEMFCAKCGRRVRTGSRPQNRKVTV